MIIPVINEEENISRCIRSAKKLNPIEIIVVDGGSTDKTIEIAKKEGGLIVKSPLGRGIQMMKGASMARGDVFLFLHADAIIPEGVDICDFISRGYIAGFFKLKFDVDSIAIRLVEFFANLRARIFSLPYGDQAIFVRRDVFEEIRGFKNYPFLEDIDLILRLRKKGRIVNLPFSVIVSSRRLRAGYFLSPIIVSLRNVVITLLFLMGISPFRLIKLYR